MRSSAGGKNDNDTSIEQSSFQFTDRYFMDYCHYSSMKVLHFAHDLELTIYGASLVPEGWQVRLDTNGEK